MADMEHTFDTTATETIELLEARLRRIEYAVSGHVADALHSSKHKSPATQRLADLEHALHQLASRSRVVQELLKLRSSAHSAPEFVFSWVRTDAKHPDLFQAPHAHDPPTTLDTGALLAIVMASASAYPSTSSRLTSIMDVPIPAAALSAQLIELQPRLAKVETVQAAQRADIAELRAKSAALVQKWYTRDVLRAGDTWAEAEERVAKVEQRLRRVALARRTEDAMM